MIGEENRGPRRESPWSGDPAFPVGSSHEWPPSGSSRATFGLLGHVGGDSGRHRSYGGDSGRHRSCGGRLRET